MKPIWEKIGSTKITVSLSVLRSKQFACTLSIKIIYDFTGIYICKLMKYYHF